MGLNFQMPTARWQILTPCRNQRETVLKDLWKMQVDSLTRNRSKVLKDCLKIATTIGIRDLNSILGAMLATIEGTPTNKKAIMGFRQHIHCSRKSRGSLASIMKRVSGSRKIRRERGILTGKRELRTITIAIIDATLEVGKAHHREKRSQRNQLLIGY